MSCTCPPGVICTCEASRKIVNLAVTNYVTGWHEVPLLQFTGQKATSVSIQIVADTTLGWGAATAALQYKVDDGTVTRTFTGQAFDPAVTFSTSTTTRRLIAIAGATHIRLTTTAAASGVDPAAQYSMEFA